MNPDNTPNEQNDTLKSFLREDLDGLSARLGILKGKLKKEDFDSLQAELSDKRITMESLEDEDSHLYILRREIAALKDSAEALAVKQSWWSRIPVALWVAIITLPIIAYIAWLSFVQWRDQGQIYDYTATETAVAAQATVVSIPTITPTPIPTVTQ